VQQLVVFTEPTHALVEVDGKLLGTSPASVELIAGAHRLLVKDEGFEAAEQAFEMDLQRSMERTVTLRPVPAPPSPPVVSTSDAPLESKPLLVPREEDPKRGPNLVATAVRPSRVGMYVAGGVAVASLATAIALGVTAQRTAATVSTAPIGTAPATAQSAHTVATLANGGYGLAGAAAVTAVVLFFVERAQ
jgi:PEGA domain